ncbi:MAG: hypothetical protein ABUS57_19580, partial [Pseudomonadota bacterium]
AVMSLRFWLALVGALAVTLLISSGVGLAAATMMRKPPPERYATGFFEISLAPGWHCERDGTEIVCTVSKPPYPAIMIIAVKQRNGADNLGAYAAHLRQPQERQNRDGTRSVSKVAYVRSRVIAGHQWIDGLHDSSEVANYWTNYLATNTSFVGVLVTFSAHHRYYEQYKPQFDEMIGSLYIYQK